MITVSANCRGQNNTEVLRKQDALQGLGGSVLCVVRKVEILRFDRIDGIC